MRRPTLYATLASALLVFSTACGSLVDIRPDALKAAPPTASQSAEARAIVERMQRAHGIDQWRQFTTMEASVQDEWFNRLFFALGTPYANNPEPAHVTSRIHAFPDATVSFEEGKSKGRAWRVRGTELTVTEPGEAPEVMQQDDEAFFATFVHNFLLWPNVTFQLSSADQYALLEDAEWEGASYHRVLISWRTLEPQSDRDQWILWIARDTHRLERVWFTVRMAGKSQKGGYNLRDFREVQGMTIAHTYEGMLDLEDDAPLHTYTYRDIRFGTDEAVTRR